MLKKTDNNHKNYRKNTITCLIPFYDEGEKIFRTLDIITKLKNVKQIICVDDGSKDKNYKKITKRYPQIKLIRLEKNQGKSSAILHGLISVTTEWVFLLDADLNQLKIDEFQKAINTILTAKDTDMLILRRANYSKFVTFLRHDILMSGERIMKTSDAINVFKKPPTGYQLEVAINFYFLQQNKKCYWQQTSLVNSYKITKWSPTQAMKKYFEEISGYASYAGPINYFEQLKNFCKKEHPLT